MVREIGRDTQGVFDVDDTIKPEQSQSESSTVTTVSDASSQETQSESVTILVS